MPTPNKRDCSLTVDQVRNIVEDMDLGEDVGDIGRFLTLLTAIAHADRFERMLMLTIAEEAVMMHVPGTGRALDTFVERHHKAIQKG